jgi:hypothetical protein
VFHRDRDPYILNPMGMLNENKSDVPRPSPLKVSPSTTSHTPPRNDSPSPDYVKSGSSSIKSFGRGTQLGTNTTPRIETYPINTDIMDHVAVPKPLAPHSSCEGLSRKSDLRTAHATEYPVDEQRSIGHDQNVVTPSPYEYNWANGAVYSKEANTHPYQSSNVWPSGAAALQQDRDNVGYDVSPPDSPTAYRPHNNRSEISSLGVSLPNTFSEHQMPHVEQARPAPPELPDNSQNEFHTRLDPKYHVRQSLVDKVQSRSKSTRENHRRSRRGQKCKTILIGVLILVVLSVVVTVLVVRIWGPARHRQHGVGTSTASSSSLTGSVSSTRTTDGMWGNTTTHTMRINSTITHEPGEIYDSTATRTAGGIHSSIKTHATSEVRGSTKTHTTDEVQSSSTSHTKKEVNGSTETHATSKTHSSTSSVATKESVTHHSKYSASTTAAVTT